MRQPRLIPLMACLLVAGCAGGQGAQSTSAPPPSSAAPAALPPASSLGVYDGLYVGTAVSMRRGAVNCPPELTLKNFRVVNDQVQFGGFRGAIQRDGSVQIPNRSVWLTGRFSGSEFRGEFTQYAGTGRFGRAASLGEQCTYATALRRGAS